MSDKPAAGTPDDPIKVPEEGLASAGSSADVPDTDPSVLVVPSPEKPAEAAEEAAEDSEDSAEDSKGKGKAAGKAE